MYEESACIVQTLSGIGTNLQELLLTQISIKGSTMSSFNTLWYFMVLNTKGNCKAALQLSQNGLKLAIIITTYILENA